MQQKEIRKSRNISQRDL